MKQIATVTRVLGEEAEVRVKQQSACEGCHVGTCLGCAKTVTAVADNPIGAALGDTVEIESTSWAILGYAAAVFLFPLLLAFVAYAIAERFSPVGWISSTAVIATFVIAFLLAAFLCDRYAKHHTRVTIVARISDAPTPSEDPHHAE